MTALYHTGDIDIVLKPGRSTVVLNVTVPEQFAFTDVLPETHAFLEANCESVLSTRCFNPDNLAFSDEVKNTEMAHLLEHLLLDMLVHEKVAAGTASATFRGETQWNWNDNPVGTFEIELAISKQDRHLLELVIPRAMELLEQLFHRTAANTDTAVCV
jgi:hypothetical protein